MEFVEFLPIQNEKYIGIVTMKFGSPGESVYLKFKVMPGKEGRGYYTVGPSYKVGDDYMQAIVVDSNWMKEQMDSMVRKAVRESFNKTPPQQTSVFGDSHYSQADKDKFKDEEIPF